MQHFCGVRKFVARWLAARCASERSRQAPLKAKVVDLSVILIIYSEKAIRMGRFACFEKIAGGGAIV